MSVTDEDDLDELFEDDDWEDADFEKDVNEKHPGWYLVKLPGFTTLTFEKVRNWLEDDNIHFGRYETVGWRSGCAYSVGVVFESGRDAMLFKLKWR